MRKVMWILLSALLLSCAGCIRTEVKAKRALGVDPQPSYPKLVGYQLDLKQVSPRVMYCGSKGEVTFALRNTGKKSIRLDEWFSNEPDNIVVYCQPWLTGMTGPDDSGWIELSFDPKLPPIRYPLELMPGNRVFVTKELPFVSKLAVSPGAERRFFIRARLNLTSVDVETPTTSIIVRNPPPKKKADASDKRK